MLGVKGWEQRGGVRGLLVGWGSSGWLGVVRPSSSAMAVMVGYRGALGEVGPDQSACILVAASLPRAVGIGEVDRHVGGHGQGGVAGASRCPGTEVRASLSSDRAARRRARSARRPPRRSPCPWAAPGSSRTRWCAPARVGSGRSSMLTMPMIGALRWPRDRRGRAPGGAWSAA